MKVYITYGNEKYDSQKRYALKKAKSKGNFDQIIGYSEKDIDKNFYKKNIKILSQSRGNGYWLWKPYFIVKTLEKINEGDYLFYSDSGAFFTKKVDILIKELEMTGQDIMGYELPLIECQWTKKELFINMNCNIDIYKNSNQILASFILIKKTEFSLKFFKEFLDLSSNEENITDLKNINIYQEEFFTDHRHDQSIFSLLYKKYHLKPFKDPSQFGEYPKLYSSLNIDKKIIKNRIYILENNRMFRINELQGNYKSVVFHYRTCNPRIRILKFRIKEILYKIGVYRYL